MNPEIFYLSAFVIAVIATILMVKKIKSSKDPMELNNSVGGELESCHRVNAEDVEKNLDSADANQEEDNDIVQRSRNNEWFMKGEEHVRDIVTVLHEM